MRRQLPVSIFVLIFHRWRRFRRVAVEGFSKSAVEDFHPIQGREAIMLALALMKSPSALEKHLQRHAWSIMLSINYHFPPVDSEDDPIVVGVAKHVDRLLREMQPGARLVEFFTWMRYIPSQCVLYSCINHGIPLTCCQGLPSGNGTQSTGLSKIHSCSKVFSPKSQMTW